MLFRQKSQPDVPVTRNDLTKVILASYGNVKKANVSNAIIALAQESFAKVLGLDMRELKVMPVTKGKPKIAGVAYMSTMQFILHIIHPPSLTCRTALS